MPVYSFNREGLWLANRRGQRERVGDAHQLGLCQQLVGRMQARRPGPEPIVGLELPGGYPLRPGPATAVRQFIEH